jgi:hypothetical protein
MADKPMNNVCRVWGFVPIELVPSDCRKNHPAATTPATAITDKGKIEAANWKAVRPS